MIRTDVTDPLNAMFFSPCVYKAVFKMSALVLLTQFFLEYHVATELAFQGPG